jgi:putative DNA primase/helicase
MRRRYQEASQIGDLEERARVAKWAITSESKGRLDACLALASSEQPIADAGATWDADPYLLACQDNRVVDLHTGTWRPGRQSDRLTMQTAAPYDPSARCPRFEQFMDEVTGGDRACAHYLQKSLGYSVTGDISEQCLWFLYGPGSGGKTTLLRTIAKTLGSYAYTAPFSTFLKDQHTSSVTNDLATLHGKRFVPASEVRERARLDEGRIKSLTGGDDITARFLHQEFFSFRPRLHLWLAVNQKPIVTDESIGFWRRVRLIPFTQRFPLMPGLEAELESEMTGILAWLVRGCLLWQAEGLVAPAAVTVATMEYEEDSDPLADFLRMTCEFDDDASIGAGEFYRVYVAWAERSGITGRERLSATAFGRLMRERFQRVQLPDGTRLYRGVGARIPEGLDQ